MHANGLNPGLSISPQAGGLPQRAQPLGCGGAELGSKKLRLGSTWYEAQT